MSDYVPVQQGVVKSYWELQKQFRKAYMNGNLSAMKALIARGVDPRNRDKEAALQYACWYGVPVLVLCTLTLSHFQDLCISPQLQAVHFFAN